MSDQRTVNQEVARLLGKVIDGWFQTLPKPLWGPLRFFFAFTGSATWAIVILVANPEGVEEVMGIFAFAGSTPLLALVAFVFAGWFALLLSWTKRQYGPARYFLDGLLLPALVTVILEFSRSRMGD